MTRTPQQKLPRRRIKADKPTGRCAIELRAGGMTFDEIGRVIRTGASAPRYWWNLHQQIGDAMFDTLEFGEVVRIPAMPRMGYHRYDEDTRARLNIWLEEVICE